MIDKLKLEEKLKALLKREPTENEKINAQTDQGLILSVLVDEIEILKTKIK